MFALRNTAKEILALAVKQIFPDAQLLGGDVSEIGFSYGFYFLKNHTLSQGDLKRIEERMAYIAFSNLAIAQREMMRENAAQFFLKLGQKKMAQLAAHYSKNILSIADIDGFFSISEGPFLVKTGDLKFFKILEVQQGKKETRLFGSAFDNKDNLKEFIRLYKLAKTKDHRLKGVKEGMCLLLADGQMAITEKGRNRIAPFVQLWEDIIKEWGSFRIYPVGLPADPPIFIKNFYHLEKQHSKISGFFYRSFDPEIGEQRALLSPSFSNFDQTIIFCNEEDCLKELISSLHFFKKVIKIFPFEKRIILRAPKRSKKDIVNLLNSALQAADLPFAIETFSPFPKGEKSSEPCIEVRGKDAYGMEWPLSSVKVENDECNGLMLLNCSLLGSLERILALTIEWENT